MPKVRLYYTCQSGLRQEEEEEEVEEEQDYKDDGDIKIPMKQSDDECNSVSAKKKKMSPVKNEKKTDDDVFDAITEGDLKKKCLNMWWRLSNQTLKMRMYSSPFVVAI